MKKEKTKLLVTLMLFLALSIFPIITNAANENKIAIVNTEENGYVLYIENYTSKEFKYAFSNNSNENELNLNYINSSLDNSGNQEAYLDTNTYNNMSSSKIYLYIKAENNLILSGVELNFNEVVLKSDIELVENTTKRISVDTSKKITTTETVDNIIYTVTTGAVEITDSAESNYKYQTVKVTSSEEYNSLMNLAKKISLEYSNLDIYNKIVLTKEFNKVYNELLKNAKWENVKNMLIAQPEDAENGEQYILFISKDEEIYDAQFLTSVKDYDQQYIKETNIITETSKLPITYDSIALIVILAVVVIALIVISVRIKNLNKNKEEK